MTESNPDALASPVGAVDGGDGAVGVGVGVGVVAGAAVLAGHSSLACFSPFRNHFASRWLP